MRLSVKEERSSSSSSSSGGSSSSSSSRGGRKIICTCLEWRSCMVTEPGHSHL